MLPHTDHLDDEARPARECELAAHEEASLQSEQRDRELVRRALENDIPENQIVDRLLYVTQFMRLSPSREPEAYALQLIEEEKSSFHALHSVVPPSSEDQPRPGPAMPPRTAREVLPPPEAAPPDLPGSSAAADAAHMKKPPRSPTTEPNPPANTRAAASEAAARQYLNGAFQSSDWLAVVVRRRQSGETVQRISPVERIASPAYQSWLRYMNAHGSDVYVSLNTFHEHASGRTKADLKEIRHVYLDLDENGAQKLAAIQQDTHLPRPHYVLNTSAGKYQVLWKVEDIAQDEAEALLRTLARRFGGDTAATDSTRVFRLPGFSNKKYQQDFVVSFKVETPGAPPYHADDFARVQSTGRAPDRDRQPHPNPHSAVRVRHSQSERDYAYAIRKLNQGDDPEKIIRDMASYRSVDQYDKKDPTKIVAHKKSNPRYYAEYTVTQAMVELGITRQPRAGRRSAGAAAAESDSAEMEPTR